MSFFCFFSRKLLLQGDDMSTDYQAVIVTSFWNKPGLIRALYQSSSMSASKRWKMLVVDNGSVGEAKKWLHGWSKNRKNVEVVSRIPFAQEGETRKGSAEHGAALDFAMTHLKREEKMIVIMDTDIIWMKPGWDDVFRGKLENYDHVTTNRKHCDSCPAPYISAFYMDFLKRNNISFSARTDERSIVIKPTEFNDVGWMLNDHNNNKWCMLDQKTPGIGYARALSIRMGDDIIAEHLYAGRKRSTGRIEKWINNCMDNLKKRIKIESFVSSIKDKKDKK